jgi:hypothetical protein
MVKKKKKVDDRLTRAYYDSELAEASTAKARALS